MLPAIRSGRPYDDNVSGDTCPKDPELEILYEENELDSISSRFCYRCDCGNISHTFEVARRCGRLEIENGRLKNQVEKCEWLHDNTIRDFEKIRNTYGKTLAARQSEIDSLKERNEYLEQLHKVTAQ